MIQLLTYSGKENNLKGKNVTINKIHDAQSLDEFDINIIDLRDNNIWKNDQNSTTTINIINDFNSLSIMINSRKFSDVVVLLPQNINYHYNKNRTYEGRYYYYCELKDMLDNLKKYILSSLHMPMREISLIYENTRTKINENEIAASFHFDHVISQNVLTNSCISNKFTTIIHEKIILSTLDIGSYDQLIDFLREIRLIEDKQQIPEWIKEENMFDDARQLQIIEENQVIIKDANNNIDEAMKAIRKNERYKSILYTSGDELVEVIFDIFEEMLGWNLSSFVDLKKEDFNYKNEDKVFIGEIKGITSNVKNANVSQLDNHVQEYLDDHEEEKDNIVALLVIDHQRNKPLHDREKVHENAINLAIRNKSLIIETITLLKMFEKYLNNKLTREKCLEILTNKTGLLTVDDFN